jgi:thioredoxin 1
MQRGPPGVALLDLAAAREAVGGDEQVVAAHRTANTFESRESGDIQLRKALLHSLSMDGNPRHSGRPTLAFFFTPTSGPARRVEALLAQVLQRRQKHRLFVLRRIDCDERPDLADRFGVTTIPTLVVVENRRIQGRIEGRFNCRDIERLLEPWLGGDEEPDGPVEAEPADASSS